MLRRGRLRHPSTTRALAFALADRAHRAAQGGRGSGADVAAAVYGGVICLRAPRRRGRRRSRWRCPPAVELIVFSTGAPSSTVDHVRALEALRRDAIPRRARRRHGAIGRARRRTSCARCANDDARAVVDAAGPRERRARGARARRSDCRSSRPPSPRPPTLAEELGGAAKPSGAGGGDVGVAFLTDRGAAETFRQRAPHLGLEILSIRTGASGLRREPSDPERNHGVERRSSRIPGFYRLPVDERRELLRLRADLSEQDMRTLDGGGIDTATADRVVENVVGVYALPLGRRA